MSSPYEIEIKLKVQAPQLLLKQHLKKLGFSMIRRRHFEANVVFDFKGLRLRKKRKLLRLRTVGNRHVLTYKGTPRRSSGYKVRKEFETVVEDAQRLQFALEGLGLRPVFEYQKYRTVYTHKSQRKSTGRALLLYDETPIGEFLELEGPRRWIDTMARRLGYRREDYITASYGTLYQKYCRRQGVKPGNMVFRKNNS